MRKIFGLRRSDILLLLAAVVLLVQLFYVVGLATAKEQSLLAKRRERQLRILVAAGDDVSAQSERASTRSQPAQLATTGADLSSPITLSLVLMLDGALVLMATRPKRARF